ncbi:hypothetical protein OC834_000056 [Tilletia horrida]|nr:hypothetical protein OC834_000056 [Tilletia horrida]
MLQVIKRGGHKLAFALLLTHLLTAVALGSPTGLATDSKSIELLARSEAGTEFVGANCTSDAQCLSGSCTSRPLATDSNGLHYGPLYYDVDPKRCDALRVGQSGCTTYSDCGTGLCEDGTCTLGADGERCLITYQCADVCSAGGICVAKAYDLPRGALCRDGNQCLSTRCTQSFIGKGFQRPSLADDTKVVTVFDRVCEESKLGEACGATSDCGSGSCQGGKCALQPNGGACTKGVQCYSGQCSSTTAQCEAASASAPCTQDDQCYSNACEPQACVPLHGGYGEYCPDPICGAVPDGGSCRENRDCASAPGTSCGPEHKREYKATMFSFLKTQGGSLALVLLAASLPRADHVCSTPPKAQGAGQPCKLAPQCLSGSCNFGYGSPVPVSPSGSTTRAAGRSSPGGACYQTSDCGSGSCTNGVCTLQPLGTHCSDDTQCDSGYCAYANPNDASSSTLLAGGRAVSLHRRQPVLLGPVRADVHPAAARRVRLPRICAQRSGLGGACRSYADWLDDSADSCTAEHKCAVRTGYACTEKSDCESGFCTSQTCEAAPATTTTTTTTSNSKDVEQHDQGDDSFFGKDFDFDFDSGRDLDLEDDRQSPPRRALPHG